MNKELKSTLLVDKRNKLNVLLDKINWGSDYNTERCQTFINESYTEEEIEELGDIFLEKVKVFYSEFVSYMKFKIEATKKDPVPYCKMCVVSVISYLIGINKYDLYFKDMDLFEKNYLNTNIKCVKRGIHENYNFWEIFGLDIVDEGLSD